MILVCAQSKRDTLRIQGTMNTLFEATSEAVKKLQDNSACTTLNLISATKNDKTFNLIQHIRQSMPEEVFRVETMEKLTQKLKRPRKCIVITIESFADFTKALSMINPRMFLFSTHFLFVAVDGEIVEITKIFEMLWNVYILNAYIMFENASEVVRIETFYPFKKSSCGSTKRMLVDEFVDGKFSCNLTKLFQNKVRHLHTCPIRVAASNNSVPYIFTKKFANNSYSLDGRDIKLVRTLGEALNFTIDFVYVGDEGFLLENGSASGSFEMLLQKKAELIVADYWLKVNRLTFIDYTAPYISQHIAFVIPPGAELTSIEKFVKPLDKIVWALMIIFIGVAFVVIYLVGKSSKNLQDFIFGTGVRDPYINILVAIVGGSQTIEPRRNFARSLLMMFLIFCLVMRTLYTGSLYRFLQSKVYHKEAQSIDDMVEMDFKFFTVAAILDLLQGQERMNNRLISFVNQ